MGKDDNKITPAADTRASSKDDSSTEATSQKRGRGRPRKDGSASSNGGKTEADLPRLVLVEDPTEDDEQPQPKAPSKKEPTKRKRKDVQFELKKEQMAVLIKSTFDIIGSRPGLEIWKLTQKEADTIADPLCGLMSKNPLIDRITSEYGEWIALIVALGTVIVPRLFVYMATKPKKKETVKPYVTIEKSNQEPRGNAPQPINSGDKGRTAGDSNKQPNREPSNARGNLSSQLYELVPAIQ